MKTRDPALIETLKTVKTTGCPVKARYFVESIFETMFNEIYLTAAAFCSEEADDMVQDVFLKLLTRKNFNCFPDQSEKHLQNYIIRITINLCKDAYKKKCRYKGLSNEINEDTCQKLTEVEDFGLKIDVTYKIQRLPERQKKAFVMYFLEGYQQPEIASLLQTSNRGVVNLLFRAKRTFLSA